MADIILSLNELGDLFYDLTVLMIGGSPPADVRRAWATQGAPAFDANDNVIFYKITDVESPMTALREDLYSQIGSPEYGNMKLGYTRTLQVDWIFYGTSSWDYATLVRNGLYFESNRDLLKLNNIYPVPQFAPPRRIPELFQGLWYERMDLSVKFNELIVLDRTQPYIKIVPIVVIDEAGVQSDTEVTEDSIIVGGLETIIVNR